MRLAWWVLCLLHLVPGAAALLDPLGFAHEVAGIPTDTAHFARDVGVAELTLAAAAALAALRPQARSPVVVVLGTHLVLHAGSHVVDRSAAAAEANAAVTGALVLQALLLAVVGRTLLRPDLRRSRACAPRPRRRPSARRATRR